MAKIIVVCNGKGGSTKTTTAISLAACAGEASGGRVLLCDADVQSSASFWADQVEDLPFDITASTDPALLRRLRNASEYDTVFVDTAGNLRETAILEACLGEADYCVVPMQAAALAVPPTSQTIDGFIRPRHIPYRVLLAMVDGRHSTDQDDMRQLLATKGYPVFTTAIRRYTAHERAPLNGVVVTGFGTGLRERNAQDDFRRVTIELMTDLSRNWSAA